MEIPIQRGNRHSSLLVHISEVQKYAFFLGSNARIRKINSAKHDHSTIDIYTDS